MIIKRRLHVASMCHEGGIKIKKIIKGFVSTSIVVAIFSLNCLASGINTVFTDVSEKEWYAESIEYAYENKLMNGITPTTFEPETKMTRGMIVTIIYRFEGSPDVHDTINFSDVNKSYYYCTPIIWANENGIVNGVSKDTFAPDNS